LVLGINIFKNVSLCSPERISNYIKTETREVREAFSETLPPGFQHSRRLYRSFRIDPTKTRPSSEALWRRVKKGEELPAVNPFVDLTNLLSLRFQIPFGLYDMDKVNGDVELTTGANGEWYEGIRKDRVSLQGRPVLVDNTGPFGNPSSDSMRTSTGDHTINILQVIFFSPQQQKKEVILESSERLYKRFIKIPGPVSYIV